MQSLILSPLFEYVIGMCSGSELKRIQTTAPALWEDSALPGLYFLCNILFHPENGSEIKRQQEISSRLGNLIMQNIIKFFLSFQRSFFSWKFMGSGKGVV